MLQLFINGQLFLPGQHVAVWATNPSAYVIMNKAALFGDDPIREIVLYRFLPNRRDALFAFVARENNAQSFRWGSREHTSHSLFGNVYKNLNKQFSDDAMVFKLPERSMNSFLAMETSVLNT